MVDERQRYGCGAGPLDVDCENAQFVPRVAGADSECTYARDSTAVERPTTAGEPERRGNASLSGLRKESVDVVRLRSRTPAVAGEGGGRMGRGAGEAGGGRNDACAVGGGARGSEERKEKDEYHARGWRGEVGVGLKSRNEYEPVVSGELCGEKGRSQL